MQPFLLLSQSLRCGSRTTRLDEEPVIPTRQNGASRNRPVGSTTFQPSPVRRLHSLDPQTFPPAAVAALARLSLGEWAMFGIDELNEALDDLYASHYWAARKSARGPDDPICVEIRECLYALCDEWARKWLECGEHEFQHKLQVYYRLGGRSRSSARDKMLSHALERLEMERAGSMREMTSASA